MILNYVTEGSWTEIGRISYSAIYKTVETTLHTHKSKNTSEVLFSYCEVAAGKQTIPQLSLNFLDQDNYFVVPSNTTEPDWLNYKGMLSRYNTTLKSYDKWPMPEGIRFYCVEDQKYYRHTKSGLVVYSEINDTRIWEKFFTPELVYATDSSVTKQFCKWLLTLDKYSNCILDYDV